MKVSGRSPVPARGFTSWTMTEEGLAAAVNSPETYAVALTEYCRTHSEEALYHASLLSRAFVEARLGPEEIIALHGEAFAQVVMGLSYREQARASTDAIQFLLEVMIAYGVQHQEYLELRVQEAKRTFETRTLEEQRRAEEATRADRAKSEALAMIAHELRTPISAAMGNLDLALRALRAGNTERLPRLVGTARDAMARLSHLSADLVEASRGKVPQLSFAPVELAVVEGQACAWASAVADDKGVTLTRATGPFSARVHGDEHALITVLGNLLSNAIRYTEEGGEVSVRHGVDEDWVWVEVCDTGIGMSPETQARIFEQFFRAPEAQAIEPQGMGLGLALSQRLVAAHSGRLEVESALGKGSTVRMMLPLLTAAPVQDRTEEDPESGRSAGE